MSRFVECLFWLLVIFYFDVLRNGSVKKIFMFVSKYGAH
jgi:hypothetical protein